jgi:AAA+ ATPase superfamily predicted ATPase
VLVKPKSLIDRDLEWGALGRFLERKGRLAIVYGPRRVGKSYLLDALCEATGGYRYQAVAGSAAAQLADFGRELGENFGIGPLQLGSWPDALASLARLERPFVALDELPYLTETTPELPSVLQRYVDAGEGPPLILSGSALSTMSQLVEAREPLYGRAGTVLVPTPFFGRDLAALWGVDDPRAALWVDAALGGLPGYRPLLPAPGKELDAWMAGEVLAPGSPLLDAAEADLAGSADPPALRGVYRSILAAIAAGERSFSGIARVAGLAAGALSRPLAALERGRLVERVPDPLRGRRDRYELADPHLRLWLAAIVPNRSRLQAGAAAEVWERLRDTTWPSQVLGPRWEAVVRAHVEREPETFGGPFHTVGVTTVADRAGRRNHEVDLVAVRDGRVATLGEAKLRALGVADLERLLRVRELLDAPEATLVLASATGFEPGLEPAMAEGSNDSGPVLTISPGDVYGGDG